MKRTGFYLGILFTLILSFGFFTISNSVVLGQNNSSSCVAQFTICGCMTVCAPEGGFVVGECFNPSCTAPNKPSMSEPGMSEGHSMGGMGMHP